MATLVLIEDQLEDRPGHAACVKCASQLTLGMDGQWIAATHGFKTYFVRGRLARYYREGFAVLDLTQINEDEGRYLVSMSKRSLFTKKVTP